MSSLFRTEAKSERERAWLGRIVVIRPVSFTVLSWAAFTLALAIGGLFIFGEYTRKARLTGYLAPSAGIARVTAHQQGRVEAVHVREGDQVRKDDILVLVGDGRSNREAGDLAHQLATRMDERDRALRRQLEYLREAMRTEQEAIEARLRGLRRECDAMMLEQDALERRARIAQRTLARATEMNGIGFLSQAALDREADAALEIEQRLESSRRATLALEREIAALEREQGAAVSRSRAQIEAVEAQRAALAQERFERALQYRSSIAAPVRGFVAALLVEPGHTVAAGATLATIVPVQDALEAHLFAPSRAIGFVRPGQEVALRYLAYPHQKFGSHRARVLAVSRAPLAPSELGFPVPEAGREPLYRVKVALDAQSIPAYGRREALQPGMQVEADVLLDRRRLIEWVFEPLLSLSGRM